MSKRFWTILIVPPDNGGTRTFRIGERARRALIGAGGAAGVLTIAAIAILFTPYGTPAARALLAENERLHTQLAGIDSRLSALNDTLDALTLRDQQVRLLAGLPTDTTVRPASDVMPADSRRPGRLLATISPNFPKPFLGRLGFGNRPDIEGLIQRASALTASFRAVGDTLTRNFERLSNTPSIMPTTGWLSSHFSQSRFHPVLHESRPHEGIDVSAPMGAPIIAPASGVVKSVSNEPGYGHTFEIDHGNGIVTKFAHCSRIVVHTGERVTRGQLIATVGNTGLSTGPHLHYEVHVNGRPVDPLKYVLPDKIAD